MIAGLVWCGSLISDRRNLREQLIRLHVVANSDSEEDQRVKLRVRDAVLESLRTDLDKLSDIDSAEAYLQENLPKIRETANRVLERAGVTGRTVVTLCEEVFDTRRYDTFSLPAGVYKSLRIVIGEGKGHNWWCVAFPALCIPDTEDAFKDTAVCAGFSETLTNTLSAEENYEVRFFLLDKLGQLENIFFTG